MRNKSGWTNQRHRRKIWKKKQISDKRQKSIKLPSWAGAWLGSDHLMPIAQSLALS
jgi:hypothetical protein